METMVVSSVGHACKFQKEGTWKLVGWRAIRTRDEGAEGSRPIRFIEMPSLMDARELGSQTDPFLGPDA
jgi:hypothetical protein